MPGVKSCNSYDCKYMPKTGTGCLGDIRIVDGVCVTYFEGKFDDPKIKAVRRNKGGALVNNRGAFK